MTYEQYLVETVKTCTGCGATKPLADFYTSKGGALGRMSKCKACTKAAAGAHRAANLEKVRAYDRERSKLPHRVELRKEVMARYREEHPDRYKAQCAVNNALRDGRLHKEPCCVCDDPEVEGHHYDYSKPLEVMWLCVEHHRQLHAAKHFAETGGLCPSPFP
jgi:hypothetical protein